MNNLTPTLNGDIFSITLRMAKEDSVLLYFLLESNEGLSFYSTLGAPVGATYRDVIIQGHISTKESTLELLDFMQKGPLHLTLTVI
jgi:hypothetical protein